MPKKLIPLVLIIIALIIDFGAGYYFGKQTGKEIGKEIGFQSGWEAAKRRLEEVGFIVPANDQREIRGIYGQVKGVKENKISLKIQPLSPLADPDLDFRIVEVDDNTKIIQQKAVEGVLVEGDIPAGFLLEHEETDISAIKPGQFISVKAEENIRNKKQFRATQIMIQPSIEE